MLCGVLFGCQKGQEMNKEPKVTEKVQVKATQAIFEWTVDYPGKISSVLEVGRNQDMVDATRYGSEAETTNKTFHATVTGLDEASRYYYRIIVWNPNSHFEMEVKSFTTMDKTRPTVVALSVTDITSTSATCECEVTDDGEAEVTERGVCWGYNPNPDITGNCLSNGAGLGNYSVAMTGLIGGNTCYVRAYAINSKGTGYSNEISFCPQDPGALQGKFTVSPGHQVFFSQGNLQYNASTNEWRFAEHQYDYEGENNENISPTYNGWIDLFCWGTSGWRSGANCYYPWARTEESSDYYPGGSALNDLTGDYAQADWGVYNAISNGGNQAGMWRTLTADEWIYLFSGRETVSGLHFAMGKVEGKYGLILLPDDWDQSYYSFNEPDNYNAELKSNIINTADWLAMEQKGVVFLPTAGTRRINFVPNESDFGYYWSTTHHSDNEGKAVYFRNKLVSPDRSNGRGYGSAVRLVCPVQP